MFKKLYPREYISSAYLVDYEALYERGFRGIIFDIDNTLVPHGAPADERSIKLLRGLKDMGYQVLFLSNNKEPRVKSFNDAVSCLYIHKAGKPKRSGYLHAMEMMETGYRDTLVIGDQLFTDIWGANNTGLYSILVGQIDRKEEIQIVLKRVLEKVILIFYRGYCRRKGLPYPGD